MKAVVERLHDVYHEPSIYYAVFGAKTEKPDLEIDSLDELVAAANLRTLPFPITDYFIAATIHDPGIEPPLGLK